MEAYTHYGHTEITPETCKIHFRTFMIIDYNSGLFYLYSLGLFIRGEDAAANTSITAADRLKIVNAVFCVIGPFGSTRTSSMMMLYF